LTENELWDFEFEKEFTPLQWKFVQHLLQRIEALERYGPLYKCGAPR